MRRTSWPAAALAVGLLVGGAATAARLGPAPAPAPVDPAVRSMSWYCPHGGGEDWRGVLVLGAPGTTAVTARVTSLGDGAPSAAETIAVAPGRTTLRPLDASTPASATLVEVFDGYVAAGYQLRAGGGEAGFGAEPCLPAASASWWISGLTTAKGQRATLVVANPFRSQAVIDIVLFTSDAPPLRDPAWTDVRIAPGRAATFNVSDKAPGEAAATATVVATVGRVAVGSLTTTSAGATRSAVATPVQAGRWFLPTAAGPGQAVAGVGVTGEDAVRISATVRGESGPAVAGGQLGVRQAPLSAAAYRFATTGPSTVDLRSDGGHLITAGLVAQGDNVDEAAATGIWQTSSVWAVPPTAGEEPWFPGLVIGNPGDEPAQVTVRTLPTGDGVEPSIASFEIPAGATASPPQTFLDADPRAVVVVTSSVPVVASGASTSSGLRGIAWYAQAPGVPVPEWAVAGG